MVHVNSLRCLKQVRDSPMVNFVSQMMNKHMKMRLWSSAAKSMLPGNAKCSMTSLADTKHIFRERFIYEASNFAAGYTRLTDCAKLPAEQTCAEQTSGEL